jgi:hypothetical protein
MTKETHGIWSTKDYSEGVTNMDNYKRDPYVTSVPLYCNYIEGRHAVGFGARADLTGFLTNLKKFIDDNPRYTGILFTEFEGYKDINQYLEYTIKLKDISNVFDNELGEIRTNWNNIRMLWYLKTIHENIKPVWEFDNIIDFGAGTGHFVYHCYQLGFKGEVQIVDLPQTVPIQKHLLRGLNVKWVSNKELSTNLPNTLFNSTWGFSESPVNIRNQTPDLHNCSLFIAFQSNFEGIDNKKDIYGRFLSEGNTVLKDISYLVPWDGGSTILMRI